MTDAAPARLLAIARRAAPRAPMQEITDGLISIERGLEGDHKGVKFPRRQVTLLSREDWASALAGLTDLAGPVLLPWTVRRANLLVTEIALPRGSGSLVRLGCVLLEVTAQTYPCRRMNEAHPGLLKALAPDWRGGVTTRVVEGGRIAVGDRVSIERTMAGRSPRLP